MLDTDQIRSDFPILVQRNRHGNPLVYLDNASTAQKPRQVINAITQYYQEFNANIHRGAYALADAATGGYEQAREKVQGFIGADRSEEIVFVRGATEGINLVATGCRPFLKPGGSIVLSGMEHHANLLPWQQVAAREQLELRIIPLLPDGQLNMKKAEALIDERTSILSIVHISNSLGTINPVKELIAMGHRVGAICLVDAAQSVPHQQVKVKELGCDFLVFSGHKLYGPTGIGVLYGKYELLEALEPYQVGGAMIRHVDYQESSFRKPPYKFEAGTPHIAGAVGLGAAIDYLEGIGMNEVEAHTKALLEYATTAVSTVSGLEVIGQAPDKSAILSLMLEGVHPHDMSTLLDEAGIAIRAGHHCTQPLMRTLGIPGTARVSFGIYNTFTEIDYLVAKLREVKEVFT